MSCAYTRRGLVSRDADHLGSLCANRIEHTKLEFTLTIKVRRDPHIIAQFKALAPPPPMPAPVVVAPRPISPPSKGGMLNFFRSSSPKKQPVKPAPEPEPEQPPAKAPERRLTDNFARFLKHDGMFARAFISFRDVAAHCDTQTFECSYPLIGQRIESRTLTRTMTVGEITLQISAYRRCLAYPRTVYRRVWRSVTRACVMSSGTRRRITRVH